MLIGDGLDKPESQIPALMHALNGDLLGWGAGGGCNTNGVAVAQSGADRHGELQLRTGALSVMIEVSDAPFHNGLGSTYPTSVGWSMPTRAGLKDAFVHHGARFIGLAAGTSASSTDATIRSSTSTDSAYGDMAYFADNSQSTVPASALGGSCKTGLSGAAVAADGPNATCRLIFSVAHDGTGLAPAVTSGVQALLTSLKVDVHLNLTSGGNTSVDTVNAFIERLAPQPSGGTDPISGSACITFPSTAVSDRYTGPKALTQTADSVGDTIGQMVRDSRYCFSVVPKPNTTVPPTSSAQLFYAALRVQGENGQNSPFTFGTRDLYVIVPPLIAP